MIGQVLGADPGSKVVGYSIVDLATGQLLLADCLRMRNVADADLRLEELNRLWLAFWQPGNLFRNVTHIYIEGGFAGKFRNAADQLAIARHYLRLPAKLRGLVVGPEPAPTTVKKALVGDGHAGKDAMLAFCCERYQRQFSSPDVADAIGVATYGYQEILRQS